MSHVDPIEFWKKLGDPPADQLEDARLQVHWAAQILAAAGETLCARMPQEEQRSFEWLDGPTILASHRFGGQLPLQVALRASDLSVIVMDDNADFITRLALDGKTLREALSWLDEVLSRCLTSPPPPLQRPTLDLPAHPVGEGGRFSLANPAAFEEMGRWIGNGYHAVQGVESVTHGATEVRCWAQNLDMSTVLGMTPLPDGTPRAIGVSLMPGDARVSQPYFCVEMAPAPPPDAELPPLAGDGTWIRGEWVAAVLKGTALSAESAEAQARQVSDFWNSAIPACRMLLEPDARDDAPAAGSDRDVSGESV